MSEPTPEPTAETVPAPGHRPRRGGTNDTATTTQTFTSGASAQPAGDAPAPTAGTETAPEPASGEVVLRTKPWRTFTYGERLIVPQGTKVPAGEVDALLEAAAFAGQTVFRDDADSDA